MNQGRRRSRNLEFEAFVRDHRGRLVSTAELLSAGDFHLAEDLVQATLVKIYLSWWRIRGEPAAYARRALLNVYIDHSRKPCVRREKAAEALPDVVVPHGPTALDPVLVDALSQLPQRMRAAVVLRHVQDLSVDETADLLGCSPGTVKSQTARGLDKLRAALEPPPDLAFVVPSIPHRVPTPSGETS